MLKFIVLLLLTIVTTVIVAFTTPNKDAGILFVVVCGIYLVCGMWINRHGKHF